MPKPPTSPSKGKRRKLIYLEWCDAISNTGWMTEKQALRWAEEDQWLVKNVGWIIKETKEYLVLSSKYSEETKEFGLLHKIPKTWVRKRKELKYA
jgi:hypothetical protein